ncbi:MAG: isoprenylcysteine carboxylmethyltransferase family protein [Candidatus Parabeggiatoa sp. nov. 3]|nr:MAG: isoprenylcysteine carboxylmethyltransferase family protein [Gammaproteobacteria bacterium]RKZ75047.1 MAG: isoprenylcysteine carboxylmethyltransferase family protein [Gammaproteobacteria bacterium]HEW97866.1 isoprenylcysteine carboxylmethyltransferase family protein [Beggiatoa sp.]
MKKGFAFLYGVFCVLLFNATMLYMVVFISPLFEPKLIDLGSEVAFAQALVVNLVLISLFGLQHSVMARPQFKQWWMKIVPNHLERSTYVLISTLALILLIWQWQPLPAVIWHVENPIGYWALFGLFWFGWLFSWFATSLINSNDLIGLRQIELYWHDKPYTSLPFQVVSIYKYIRHPIMLGAIISLWASPTMSVGHLILAIGFTVYIFIGIHFEEKNMVADLGEVYEQYQQHTSKLIPNFLNLPFSTG